MFAAGLPIFTILRTAPGQERIATSALNFIHEHYKLFRSASIIATLRNRNLQRKNIE
jgi:hypothetical protein